MLPRPLLRPLVGALLVLGTQAVSAQSLLELYETARGFDATYLAARAQAESAQHRAAQAEALQRPNVALAGSATRTDARIEDRERDSNAKQLALNGRQPLFNRANSASVAQARRSLEASAAELEAAEQDLIVRVAQAYFDVLAAQDTLATTRASKTAIAEQLASAKRNFEVGTATITDTREAQARFDLATAQEIAAGNDLRTRRHALDQLVGRSGVDPRPLAQPVSLPELALPAIEPWIEAIGQHPAVRRSQVALDVAQLEIDKARAGHLPTVDLVGSLARSHNSGSAFANSAQTGSGSSASVGLQLNLPLFAGFSIENRVKETVSLEEKARQDLQATRRSATLATRQAHSTVQSGRAQVSALEAAESSSKLALEATQLGYRVGVRVNLDVLNAQTQLFTTQRDLARARYDLLVAGLRLRQAAGVLAAPDLRPVDALLAK